MNESLPRPFGRFVLLESLGRGGAGTTYLAAADRSAVVIKILHARLADDEEALRRFRHEAEAAARVNSPHVVRVLESGVEDGVRYLVVERIEGWSVTHLLRELDQKKVLPPIEAVVELGLQALQGLNDLHRAPGSIVHRDLSPSNLMLDRHGVVRVIDLGLARSAFQDWRTATGVSMGTFGYMTPEQVRGEAIDATADLYALAIVLFELLTVQRYITPGPREQVVERMLKPAVVAPSELRPEVPAALDRVLLRALSIAREDRYPSAAQFREALAVAVRTTGRRDLAALVALFAPIAQLEPPRARWHLLAPVLALIAAVGLGAAFVAARSSRELDPHTGEPRAEPRSVEMVPEPRVIERTAEESARAPSPAAAKRPAPRAAELPRDAGAMPVERTPEELLAELTALGERLRVERRDRAPEIDRILARAARWAVARPSDRASSELARAYEELERLAALP